MHKEKEKSFSVDSGGHVLLPDLPQAWSQEGEQEAGGEETQGTGLCVEGFLRAGSGFSQELSPLDEGSRKCHSFLGD